MGFALFEQYYAPIAAEHTGAPEKLLAQESLKLMLNALADDLVAEMGRRVRAEGIAAPWRTFGGSSERLVAFSPEMETPAARGEGIFYTKTCICARN